MLSWQNFKQEWGFEGRGCVFDSQDLAHSRCSVSDRQMTRKESDGEVPWEVMAS